MNSDSGSPLRPPQRQIQPSVSQPESIKKPLMAPRPPKPPSPPTSAAQVRPDPVVVKSELPVPSPEPTPETVPVSDRKRVHPISPPSEPMQYRAIGLLQGHYQASEEQFTRGILQTPDGTQIDAVLLGRVMNLVRKHLQGERDYVWVVYPRTREQEQSLHVQIMGVWAPEEMGQTLPSEPGEILPDRFSVRGEVVFQSQEKGFVVVKIRQSAKKGDQKRPVAFKLRLEGSLPSKGLGDFWDLEVKRDGSQLLIQSSTLIGPVPKPPIRRRPNQQRFPRRSNITQERPNTGQERPNPRPRDGMREEEPLRTERPAKPVQPFKKKPPQ